MSAAIVPLPACWNRLSLVADLDYDELGVIARKVIVELVERSLFDPCRSADPERWTSGETRRRRDRRGHPVTPEDVRAALAWAAEYVRSAGVEPAVDGPEGRRRGNP